MRIFLLSTFITICAITKAQDFISPTGFMEDFNSSAKTAGPNSYEINWYGKQDIGSDTGNICKGDTSCIAMGATRTRSGNGKLDLLITRNKFDWTALGMTLGNNSGGYVDISSGNYANTVEFSMTNTNSKTIEVYFEFHSNGDAKKAVNGDAQGMPWYLPLAAGETKVFPITLIGALKQSWIYDENYCKNTLNGTFNSGKCIYNEGFDLKKLSAVQLYIMGEATMATTWYPAVLKSAPFSINYIKGGAVSCNVPNPPSDITPLNNLTVCKGKRTVLSVNGTGNISWYSDSTGGNFLGSGKTFASPEILHNTTFYAQDSNACGNSKRTPITITITDGPVITLTDQVLYTGESNVLDAGNSSQYSTYLWSGSISATSQQINANSEGQYTLMINNTNTGCSDTASFYITLTNGSKTNDFLNNTGFFEDFNTLGPTTATNGAQISWFGKQDAGTDINNVCKGNTDCIFCGTSRKRDGNGDLKLEVTEIPAAWNAFGFDINNYGNYIDLSKGIYANTVELSMTNNSSTNGQIHLEFLSNGADNTNFEEKLL